MDETIKSLVLQSPMVVVLLYAVKTLYLDAKLERAQMRQQIDGLTVAINALVVVVTSLSVKLDEGRDIRSIEEKS